MKARKKLSSRQLLIVVALGIALACVAGVLNGVYTLGQLASDTDVVAASPGRFQSRTRRTLRIYRGGVHSAVAGSALRRDEKGSSDSSFD